MSPPKILDYGDPQGRYDYITVRVTFLPRIPTMVHC